IMLNLQFIEYDTSPFITIYESSTSPKKLRDKLGGVLAVLSAIIYSTSFLINNFWCIICDGITIHARAHIFGRDREGFIILLTIIHIDYYKIIDYFRRLNPHSIVD
ncbi:hypothetical protein ACJX0J_019506, partial [Zea mays]